MAIVMEIQRRGMSHLPPLRHHPTFLTLVTLATLITLVTVVTHVTAITAIILNHSSCWARLLRLPSLFLRLTQVGMPAIVTLTLTIAAETLHTTLFPFLPFPPLPHGNARPLLYRGNRCHSRCAPSRVVIRRRSGCSAPCPAPSPLQAGRGIGVMRVIRGVGVLVSCQLCTQAGREAMGKQHCKYRVQAQHRKRKGPQPSTLLFPLFYRFTSILALPFPLLVTPLHIFTAIARILR